MTTTVYLPHQPKADKLEAVKAEMATLGAPKLRALWCGDHYKAIEGSHRGAAAEALGLPIEIVEVDEEDEITDHDFRDLPTPATVAEIVEYLYDAPTATVSVEIK